MDKIRIVYQRNTSGARCAKLTFKQVADYLMWAWEHDRKAKLDFATDDRFEDDLRSWWGVQISFKFDFTIIMAGHYGELGDDCECNSLNRLVDEMQANGTIGDPTKEDAIAWFLERVMIDHDGTPEYMWCEIDDTLDQWLNANVNTDDFEVINNQ